MSAGSIFWRVVRTNLHGGSGWDEGSDGVPILAVESNAFQETAMLFQSPFSLSIGFVRPSYITNRDSTEQESIPHHEDDAESNQGISNIIADEASRYSRGSVEAALDLGLGLGLGLGLEATLTLCRSSSGP